MELSVLGALIGLAGAVSNNGKTEATDCVIIQALLCPDANEAVRSIHREKFIISPGCETCPRPCGNTSDRDLGNWETVPEEVRTAKEAVIKALEDIACRAAENGILPETAYKAITYLGYDLKETSYRKLLEELKNGA